MKTRLVAGLVPEEAKEFVRPPFDLYCPSMKEKLSKCICSICALSWPSEAAMKRHKTCHKMKKDDQLVNFEEEVSDEFCQMQDEVESNNTSNVIPVVQNLQEFLRVPFRWPDGVSGVEFDEMLL